MRKIALISLLLTFSFARAFSQDFSLKDFEERNISNIGKHSNDIDVHRNSLSKVWNVYSDGSVLKIRQHTWETEKSEIPIKIDSSCFLTMKGRIVSKKVFNGWLVSSWCLEFGNLKWYSENGGQSYQISQTPYHKFVQYNNKLLGFENSSHLGIGGGGIDEIVFNQGTKRWELVEIYTSRDSYPVVIMSKNDDEYIVTSSRIEKRTIDGPFKTLAKDIWTAHSVPNSIVFYKDALYLGMPGGILKVEEKKQGVLTTWFEKRG